MAAPKALGVSSRNCRLAQQRRSRKQIGVAFIGALLLLTCGKAAARSVQPKQPPSVEQSGDCGKGVKIAAAAQALLWLLGLELLRRGRVRTVVPVPPSFPVAPPPVMENPALFERLALDALCFSFSFQQGTVQQLLAARELKRSNWRFHKKHNTWFARQEEPKLVTDEFEQGSYLYFDFTCGLDEYGHVSGWCQRSRPNFTFEYSQLEDEAS